MEWEELVEVRQRMVPEEMMALLQIFVFPGFLFLILLAFFIEWIDRKLVAKFQNRYGPLHVGPRGLLQPIADFIKLLSKEDITPAAADKLPFSIAPPLLLTLALTPLFCIPMVGDYALVWFEGDLIVTAFLMTLTVLLLFIAAWSSTDRFGTLGGIRLGLQMFAYEVPLGLAMIGPAVVARSLSISRIVQWQAKGLWFVITQPIGFAVFSVSLLAHLQRIPFDIPEAETEIVTGWLVEFSGKKLALFRLVKDIEVVLAGSLMVSLYLGGPFGIWQLNLFVYLIKLLVCVFILSNLRALFARFRIDQVLSGAWKYLTPLAFSQLIITELLPW